MKLYRKLDNAVIGGVLSGISDEYGIDLRLLRIITLLLLFISVGIVGLVYIVLWAVLPAKDSDSNIKDEVQDIVKGVNIKKGNKQSILIIGILLIVVGLLLFFNYIIPIDVVLKIVLPIALIGVGIYFIVKSNK